MELAREMRFPVAAGAPGSKKVQEGSKSQRRGRWRKGKAKGEWEEAGRNLRHPVGNWGLNGLTSCHKKWGGPWTGSLLPCGAGVRG